ncbi:MAG: metal ABC transporter substrate-binding protein [Planctomycetota bacterium]
MTLSRSHSLACVLALSWLPSVAAAQATLRVAASIPDLGSLAQAVGGNRVHVDSLVRGPEDPHFTQPRPSLVRTLAQADLLVVVGLELEAAWLQPLCDNARNRKIARGGPGHVDASRAVTLRGVPAGRTDRSLGDVHPGGNPHYLSDPLCGLQVAKLIRDRLSEMLPDGKSAFRDNCDRFRRDLCTAMVGAELARAYDYDANTLGRLYELDQLDALLDEHGDGARLSGWFGALRRHRGVAAVADHDLWPYFAARFAVRVRGFFEPRAGVAPTTRHLTEIVALMRAEHIGVILSSPYFSPQHAEFVAAKTGARIARLAHQVGARDGCADYLATIDHNVRALLGAIGETGGR